MGGNWWVEIGRCLPLFFSDSVQRARQSLLLQKEGDLLVAGGLPLQHLLVLWEFLLPVLEMEVLVGLVLGVDLFGCAKWPFDPFPNFVG